MKASEVLMNNQTGKHTKVFAEFAWRYCNGVETALGEAANTKAVLEYLVSREKTIDLLKGAESSELKELGAQLEKYDPSYYERLISAPVAELSEYLKSQESDKETAR